MPFLGQESQDVQMDFVRIAPFVRFKNVDKLTNVDVHMSGVYQFKFKVFNVRIDAWTNTTKLKLNDTIFLCGHCDMANMSGSFPLPTPYCL